MDKSTKPKKFLLLIGIIGILTLGYVVYLFNEPHRNVQDTKTDYSYNSSEIVNEYLTDASKANAKYLAENGDSKIIEVNGVISEIQTNFNGNTVIVLQDSKAPAGVSCTLLSKQDNFNIKYKPNDHIIIKGVIRAGASFDRDLGMYENVVLEECSIIK